MFSLLQNLGSMPIFMLVRRVAAVVSPFWFGDGLCYTAVRHLQPGQCLTTLRAAVPGRWCRCRTTECCRCAMHHGINKRSDGWIVRRACIHAWATFIITSHKNCVAIGNIRYGLTCQSALAEGTLYNVCQICCNQIEQKHEKVDRTGFEC